MTFRIRPLTRNISDGKDNSFNIWVLNADIEARIGLVQGLELFSILPIQHKRLSVIDNADAGENLTGLGDLRLGVRTSVYQSDTTRMVISGGLSLPTGNRNSVARANFLSSGERESLGLSGDPLPNLQLGSGAVSFLVGIDSRHTVNKRLSLSASVLVNFSSFENGDGYTFGNTYNVATGPIFSFGGGKAVGLLVNLFKSEHDSFDGEDIVSDDVLIPGLIPDLGNGRFEVALRPYFSWPISEKLSGFAELNIPLHTEIDSGERPAENVLREPAGIFFGFRTRF